MSNLTQRQSDHISVPGTDPLCGQRDAIDTLLAIAKRYRHLEQCMLDPGAQAHFRDLALDYEQRADQIAEAMRTWPEQS
jgi:hypothetical protein